MRYPLTIWQEGGRELLCFFCGHKWKSSWCRRAKPLPEDTTYKNPWWHYVSSWRYKCRRCRERTTGENYHPWYKVLWWAVKQFCRCSVVSLYGAPWQKPKSGHAYAVLPWRWWLFEAILGGPAFAFEQAWLCYMTLSWHWPSFPGRIAGEFYYWVADKTEPHYKRFRWVPPGSSDPHEVGYHLNADVENDPPMRVYFYTTDDSDTTTPMDTYGADTSTATWTAVNSSA